VRNEVYGGLKDSSIPFMERQSMANNPPGTEHFHALSEPAVLLATWFGSGLLPVMPGTWGSLTALPFAWALHITFGWVGLVVATGVAFAVGIWASNGYISRLGGDDPGPVVIDEVVGQWLTLAPAAYLAPFAPDLITYLVAFVLFRIADIFKPWPASWADRTIHGGLGIMLDDILAAVYSGLALTLYLQYLG
jgi:phosphatidylglycerophosphatase A